MSALLAQVRRAAEASEDRDHHAGSDLDVGHSVAGSPERPLAQLHRTHGNAFVQRVLARTSRTPPIYPSSWPPGGMSRAVIQRQPGPAARPAEASGPVGPTQTGTATATAPAVGVPATTPPRPLPGMVGNVGYYAARHADFIARHPTAPPSPPDYYMSYGDKYARRFTTVLRPTLSAAGQGWVDRTFVLLQQAIENRLTADPVAFDALERDGARFRAFAYATHPRAYLDGGLHSLPATDLARIGSTPDLGDLTTIDGVKQVLETGVELVPQWGGDAVDSAVSTAQSAWGWLSN